MNKPTNKPLTYNRFRAYLRIKLKNKSFSKTRVFLIIAVYILLSLTIFLLPHNVLTQYPYLKYFTDFMDFIPAIKQMEIKTYAPEMCKLYASYMFVVGVVCFWFLLKEFFVWVAKYTLHPNVGKNVNFKALEKIKKHPIKLVALLIFVYIACLWGLWLFLSGWTIGHSKYRSSDEYFIYTISEMLYYVIWQMGAMFFVAIAWMIILGFGYLEMYKYYMKRKNNG